MTLLQAEAPPTAAAEDVVLSLDGVGKAYRLYDKPIDRLKQMFLGGNGRQFGKDFWALRDISFQVRRGQTLGLIGRNGSGKSTLLQIIAGVLKPTTGSMRIGGRVAAMLELGSGFNPEYTGRENVFLNGTILGLSHREMEKRFDEIAAFADIDEFIERPVKTYSSGMYMRLAFAVATCVKADILLIDEVLAVGDVFFRQKCYRRLAAMREAGTAIILVSHAMTEVEQFCRQGVLLHHGAMRFSGSATEAVKRFYLIDQEDRAALRSGDAAAIGEASAAAPLAVSSGESWPTPEQSLDITDAAQVSNGWARCTGIWLCDGAGRPSHLFEQGDTAVFLTEYEVLRDLEVPIGGVVIQSDKGTTVHGKNTLQYDVEVPRSMKAGTRVRFRQEIGMELQPGEYTFGVGLATIGAQDFARRGQTPHQLLESLTLRLCHLPQAGQFGVVLRVSGRPVQLMHHGLANLPGRCTVSLPAAEID